MNRMKKSTKPNTAHPVCNKDGILLTGLMKYVPAGGSIVLPCCVEFEVPDITTSHDNGRNEEMGLEVKKQTLSSSVAKYRRKTQTNMRFLKKKL